MVSDPFYPGIGGCPGIGTGTGTKIYGTVPVLKSRELSRGISGTGAKIAGLSHPVQCPSLVLSYSQTVGMDSLVQTAVKKDFSGNPFSGSAAGLLDIILKFIFTPIYGIKISEKKYLAIISFSKADFHKSTYFSIHPIPKKAAKMSSGRYFGIPNLGPRSRRDYNFLEFQDSVFWGFPKSA